MKLTDCNVERDRDDPVVENNKSEPVLNMSVPLRIKRKLTNQ